MTEQVRAFLVRHGMLDESFNILRCAEKMRAEMREQEKAAAEKKEAEEAEKADKPKKGFLGLFGKGDKSSSDGQPEGQAETDDAKKTE